MDKLKISVRLLLIVLGTIVGIVAVGGYSLFEIRANLFEDRKTKTQHVVHVVEGVIAYYHAQEASGAMTRDEARKAAVTIIRELRYKENDYFWIQTYDNFMVMHPIQPALNGTDLTGYTDPNGVKMFDKMVSVVTSDGAGFVEYAWPKPGYEVPVPKLSFVKGFPPWRWIVGSGIYVDDVNSIFRNVLSVDGVVSLIILCVIVGASTIISRGITKPLSLISRNMLRLADGDRSVEVKFTDQNNEIGDLSRTMEVFRQKSIEMDHMREEQRNAERRFQRLFENSEVSIWNEDFSEAYAALEKLRDQGVVNLRQFLDASPQTARAMTTMVKVVQVNESTLKLFGATAENGAFHQIDMLFGQNAIEVFIGQLCAIWDRRQDFRSEAVMRTVDGRSIDVIISFRVPETEEGFHSIPVNIIDITERKRSELALKKSERRFDLALRSTQDGIWDYIQETDELFISPRWKEMLGYADQEIKSDIDPFPGFLHPDDRPRVLGAIEEFFNGREIRYEQEFRMRNKDGHYLTVQATAFAERDVDGKVTRFAGRHTDVTEIRETEHQLLQAQKMEAVGHLTGGIAHDFNNLLAIISLNMGLMQEEVAGNPELEELAGRTLSAVNRGATLTQRLLSFSRRQALSPETTDLGRLIAELEDMLRRTLGETVKVRMDPTQGLWPVSVDAHQLESAILNLALNARDAMPDGGTLIIETANAHLDEAYASTHDEVDAGDYVLMTISDTGIGMPQETLERVIEPFFTTKEVGKGSGLGLSMVYGFIKQSKGHFSIASTVGEGTKVKLFLPRDTSPMSLGAGAEVDGTPSVQGHERILVVEDEEEVRRVAVEILRMEGYDVVEAGDGVEALETLENEGPVDLLFSDVVLPNGMSGPALAKKAEEIQPGLKAFFTTGYADGEAVQDAALDSGTNLISKPYARMDLLARIRAAIDSSAQG